MTATLPRIHTYDFRISGAVDVLVKGGGRGDHVPTRPLGGWLMTYGKLAQDGTVRETVDRDGHTVDAAKRLGAIDWSGYTREGLWNDTHDETVIVGVPTVLEFHDGHTELSREHRKVGFWTEGHLFDRRDPRSWTAYTDRVPSPVELDRADHFWQLAKRLQGLARGLGLSAHGFMRLSPCRRRIIWAQVRQAAVCELPKNPDATLEILAKGGNLLDVVAMAKGDGWSPCAKCRCPPGACQGLLKADPDGGMPVTQNTAPVDPDNGPDFTPTGNPTLDRLLISIMQGYFTDQETAQRWVDAHLQEAMCP